VKEEETFAKFDADARCGCAVQPGAKPDCRQAGFMRHMGVSTTSNVHLLEPALWGEREPKVRRWEPCGGRVPVDEATLRVAESEIPRCPHGCGALARPNVYMFDDDRWVSHRADEQVGKGHPGPPGLL